MNSSCDAFKCKYCHNNTKASDIFIAHILLRQLFTSHVKSVISTIFNEIE